MEESEPDLPSAIPSVKLCIESANKFNHPDGLNFEKEGKKHPMPSVLFFAEIVLAPSSSRFSVEEL